MLPKSTSRTRLRIVSPAAINNAKTMGVNNLIAGSSGRVWWPEVISHDNTEECRAFCLEHAEQSFIILETGLSLLPECTIERQFHDKTTALYSCSYIYIQHFSHSIYKFVICSITVRLPTQKKQLPKLLESELIQSSHLFKGQKKTRKASWKHR